MNCVSVVMNEMESEVELEWMGNSMNDMIADCVLALILQSESSPASVKGNESQ